MTTFAALLMMLTASPVLAKSIDVFVGGRYSCEFDGKPSFVGAQGPFELDMAQSGIHSRSRHAKLTTAEYSLKATIFKNSTFHDVKSNFPTKKNMEIAYIYLTGAEPESTQVEVSLAFKTQADVYAFDRLKCQGESAVKKVPIVQVDCAINEMIKETPTITHVRFALANMIDAQDFLLLNYSGDLNTQNPVQISPKSSHFSSLNENLRASLTRDYMLLEGGSFDQYRIFVRIERPSMTRGTAWLESGKEDVGESRRDINCKVKGPVTPHPQERMH